jgi:HSP20 family protein
MSLFFSNPFALVPSRTVDPFEDFDHQFNSQLNAFPFFRGGVNAQNGNNALSSVPPLDLEEHKKNYKLKLSVPGVAPSDLIVDFDTAENTLHIKGETSSTKSEPTEEGSTQKRITERYSGTFERTVQFPSKVKIDDDNIVASLVNGVLTLKIPKIVAEDNKKAAPKRIHVGGDSSHKALESKV